MASTKGKFVSVGVLHYRSELDDKKTPARTYNPGDTIEEDLDKAEIDRLLQSGAIKESKEAEREQKAREEAAEAAAAAKEAEAAVQAQAAAQAEAAGAPADAPVTKAGKK